MQSTIQEIAVRTIQLEAQAVSGLTAFINDDFEKAIEAIRY
jgi:hypothetical protein